MLNNIPTTPYINPELSYSKTLLASLGINEVVEIKGSHWYCDPSIVKKEVIFGPTTTIFVGGQEVVDATLIKSMQNSMFFQLAIGDESVIANNNRNLSLIINGTSTQVDRELVCKQSSVLKQLIESSSEVEEVQADYLQKVITFIHDGKLGIESAKFTSQQDVGLVNLKDLIELIKLADKYQVEGLLVEISKVVNDLTAMIIIEECNTISNIGKKIVLEKCYEFIGFNPPSIVAAKVYKDKPLVTNFMEDLMKKMQELNIQAEDEITDYIVKEYDNHVDISNNRKNFAKFVSALRMDATLITFSELDTEALFGILNSKYLAMKPELILCVLASWYFADTTNRLEIACQYILENNWSDCGREIYNFIFHNVFIFSAMKLENSDLQDKLRDLLSQTMFKKENVMGKEWDLYNQNKPQRGLYINFGGDVRVLMLGLDHSGKTSILYMMKLGEIVNSIPTIGFNVETVNHSGSNLTVWDVGGQDKIRPLWRHYYTNTSIIVFVVDANDRERFDDACDCIQRLASEDELKDCPILIFANKMDRAGCASIEEIVEKLELKRLNNPNWMVQGCSVTEKVGLDEGFKLVLKALNIKSASIEQVTAQENEKVPKTTSHFGRFEPKFNSF